MIDAFTRAGRNACGHGEGHGQQTEGQSEVGRKVCGAEMAPEPKPAVAGQTGHQEGHTSRGVSADGEFGGNHVKRACRDHQLITSSGKGRMFGGSVAGATRLWRVMNATIVTIKTAKDWT